MSIGYWLLTALGGEILVIFAVFAFISIREADNECKVLTEAAQRCHALSDDIERLIVTHKRFIRDMGE